MRNGNPLHLGWIESLGKSLVLNPSQRGKHLAVFGGTGTGKSKLIEHMIRSDILAWPKSGAGVVLIDPHGALFDAVTRWVAAGNFRRWPIIPIDLRRDDWVVAYNLLRRRDASGGDPAVWVTAFARAILHAWGQADGNETPRLSKWLRAVLSTLYERNASLADGLALIADPELRRGLTGQLQDRFARTVWEEASHLRPGEFHEEVASTMNRLLKFLSNETIRATLCQTEVSLDLSQALEKGAIVLVCLATDGGRIDEEDATTFGSLLLSDLWTAAKARGKRDEGLGGVRPTYVYLDEFQRFVSPVMAETLDQARGFGLHFTLSSQYPTQMLVRGETGKQVYHSIMANCRNKVVFSLEHPDDLLQLGLWLYRQWVDPDQIKHRQASTKVMGYHIAMMESSNQSRTETTGETETEGTSHTSGSGRGRSHGVGIGGSHGESWGEGGSSGRSSGRSRGGSSGSSAGVSDGESYLEPDEDPWSIPAEEPRKTLSHNDSSGTSAGDSWTDSDSSSESESWSDSGSDTESWNESMTESESWSEADTSSSSHSVSRSTGETRGTSHSPMLIPIMGQELLPPQFRSIEEQLFILQQYLAGQPDRHCVARLAGEQLPVPLVTFDVKEPLTTRRWLTHFTQATYRGLPFALPKAEALRRVEARQASFAGELMKADAASEPLAYARTVDAVSVPRSTVASPMPTAPPMRVTRARRPKA